MDSLFPFVFPAFFVLFFVLILGVIVFAIVQAIIQYVQNSNSPVLQTPARIIGKRSEVSRGAGSRNSPGRFYTTYYVAFEYASGERREFEVKGNQFGVLMEGDRGTLISQGTWFKDFVRGAGSGGDGYGADGR